MLLTTFILKKIDSNTNKDFELSLKENTFPTLQDLLTFLEKHRKGLDHINGKLYQKEDNVRKTFKTYQVNTNIIKCTYCNSSHKLGTCQEFAKLSLDDRIKFVRSKNLCINCLGVNHYANHCQITATCKVCNKKHHTTLHNYNNQRRQGPISTTEHQANTIWPHLNNLKLADPEFYIPRPIDIIIGADVYLDLIEPGLTKGPRDAPSAMNSKLSWIISGDSKSQALRRFLSLERRFHRNPVYSQHVREFMQEYINLGHMKVINEIEPEQPSRQVYYMPYHAVLRDQSTTTKLRVVFNASAKTSTGLSSNDLPYCGPKLQEDIFNILIKFRTYSIALTADIEKMYRQIRLNPADCCFQRILWRASPNEPIKEYQLVTVTYGTTSAPYLAIKTLKTLAHDEQEQFPQATNLHLDLVSDLSTGSFIAALRRFTSRRGPSTSNLPETDNKQANLSINLSSRWKHIQELKKLFILRWKKEYVINLQKRGKWKSAKPNVKIGDLVLIMEQSISSPSWILGRVSKTFHGPDMLVRTVELRTGKGLLRRPVNKVAVLPVQSDLTLTTGPAGSME
ncbi:hypothetical protein LAZ67_8000719, partial [Cordylochernes scorpioides]